MYPDAVYTEGITKITLEDVAYIQNYGGVIKLLGRAKRLEDGKISAVVSPAVVMHGSQLASVTDVFNAILVRGDAIGDVVFYGKGAGKLPTASAVVADVIDCAKHVDRKKAFGWGASEENYVVDYKTLETALYIRTEVSDKATALAAVEAQFGKVRVLSREDAPANELAFVTGTDTEQALTEKLENTGLQALSCIRVTDY